MGPKAEIDAMKDDSDVELSSRDAVDSRGISLHLARYKFAKAVPGTPQWFRAVDELEQVLKERQAADEIFARIFAAMPHTGTDSDLQLPNKCTRKVLDNFQDQCEPFNSYSLKYARPLVELCSTYSSSAIGMQMSIACGVHLEELIV